MQQTKQLFACKHRSVLLTHVHRSSLPIKICVALFMITSLDRFKLCDTVIIFFFLTRNFATRFPSSSSWSTSSVNGSASMAWKVPKNSIPQSKVTFHLFYFIFFSGVNSLSEECIVVRWRSIDCLLPPFHNALLLHARFWRHSRWHLPWKV